MCNATGKMKKKTIVFVAPGIANDKESKTIACVAFGKRQAVAQSGHEKARSPNPKLTHVWRPEKPRRRFNERLLMVFKTA